MEENSNIAIIILAAGSSSRMGSPKQLLAWGDITLIEHTINQAERSDVNGVYIVLGANHEKIRSKITTLSSTVIINDNWQSGLGSSLASGIEHLQRLKISYDGILIMLADQPEVDTAYLNKLMLKFKTERKQIIATSYEDQIGVPAIFTQKHYDQLSELSGDKGAKKIIGENLADVATLSPKTKFIDIDTQDTYEKLLRTTFIN